DYVTGAGVTGLTTAIDYVGSPGTPQPLTEGVPPSWPSTPWKSDVVTQIFDYSPNVTDTVNGHLDTAHTTFFTSAPAGAWVMPYHEPAVGGTAITPAQC